jgi:hypothetical protein
MANVSQAYHWFILRIVMPLGVSCTVVIHYHLQWICG